MKDRIHETPITPDAGHFEEALEGHKNFAIISLPAEYGDQAEIQQNATAMVKGMDLQGKYDCGWESVSLEGLDENAQEAIGEEAAGIEPLIRYYAKLAKTWGFTDQAQLNVMIQSDKVSSNPNETLHRDGVGGTAALEAKKGKSIRSIRFVYPIGRPGTILYPELDHTGAPIANEMIVDNPTKEQEHLSPRFLPIEGDERQQTLDESGAVQLIPGATLVFDMTNSPWHIAPPPTPDGAVMTVGVYESW